MYVYTGCRNAHGLSLMSCKYLAMSERKLALCCTLISTTKQHSPHVCNLMYFCVKQIALVYCEKLRVCLHHNECTKTEKVKTVKTTKTMNYY